MSDEQDTDRKETLLIAKDAWLEERDFREVLAGNGIEDEVDEASKLPTHDLIEWEWVFDEARPARTARHRERRQIVQRAGAGRDLVPTHCAICKEPIGSDSCWCNV